MHRGRTVYGFKSVPFEIGDDLSHAVYSTGAYGIEKLRRELRKTSYKRCRRRRLWPQPAGKNRRAVASDRSLAANPVRKTRSYFST